MLVVKIYVHIQKSTTFVYAHMWKLAASVDVHIPKWLDSIYAHIQNPYTTSVDARSCIFALNWENREKYVFICKKRTYMEACVHWNI